MIVIRRMVDRHRAYTGIFLKGEPPQIFPTSDHEHARILQVYKQDRPHEGIINDFSEDDFRAAKSLPARPAQPVASKPKAPKRPKRAKAKSARPTGPLWLIVIEPTPAPKSKKR